MNKIAFDGKRGFAVITTLSAWVALILQIYYFFTLTFNTQAVVFTLIFSIIAVVLLTLQQRRWRPSSFTPLFLLSTFAFIVAWRIGVLVSMPVVPYIYLIGFIFIVLNFLYTAYRDVRYADQRPECHHNSAFEWQLIFIRLYIGFDTIPHFAEKLFAGASVRMDDVTAFTQLGVPNPYWMVIIAGLIELGGALSLSMGFLTRLGSICFFIYLMVATTLGHHFSLGFIWASPGGGWEYPVLWSVVVISFCVLGANTFSLDSVLRDRVAVPGWVQKLMGGRR